MSEKPHRCVLLADRHHGLAEGIRGLLQTTFSSVIMVADEASLQIGISRLHPDLAIVDLSLAPSRGLDWLASLRRHYPWLKVLVISAHDEESVRQAAMAQGADAFVLKRNLASDLLEVAERLVEGEPEQDAGEAT